MKTIKYLSMAALALVGTMTVGCSSDDNFIEQTQQPVNSNNVVTLTATVGFDEAASNRALAIDYTNKKLTKTFAEGDQIAVIYENTSGTMVKETATIAAGDISTDGKSAKFTVSMTDPKASGTLKYIYPAAMAGATDVDYTKLASQDGKLATLASKYDLATFEGTLTDASELPVSAALKNKLAILALTIKNSEGTSDLTGITGMNIIAGTNIYSITGKDADGHIYAAIQPTSGANISYFATDGIKNYTKAVTDKTYAANNIYNLGLRMTDASVVSLAGVSEGATINVSNGQTITGALTDDEGYLTYATITIEDGAIVTLKDVVINQDGDLFCSGISGITCAGNATIILEGTNIVKGFERSGIEVKSGKTLTILGTGELNASGYSGAGIGGEGNIVIMGGTINATGTSAAAGIGGRKLESCGNITISGGIINATGGSDGGLYGAGIGGGASYSIPNTTSITITSGVEKVTATRGGDGGYCKFIGAGSEGYSGVTLTIDGVANATTSSTFTNFNSSVSGNTWTLMHK